MPSSRDKVTMWTVMHTRPQDQRDGPADSATAEPLREADAPTGYCPECGSPHGAAARFCPTCGRRLSGEVVAAAPRVDVWTRAAAWGVDVVILQPAYIALAAGSGGGFGAYFLWAYVLAPLYMILWEASRYQATPGKLLFKIKVVNEQGDRPTLKRVAARTLVSVVNLLTLFVTFFMGAIRDDRLALQDMVTRTTVVHGGWRRT